MCLDIVNSTRKLRKDLTVYKFIEVYNGVEITAYRGFEFKDRINHADSNTTLRSARDRKLYQNGFHCFPVKIKHKSYWLGMECDNNGKYLYVLRSYIIPAGTEITEGIEYEIGDRKVKVIVTPVLINPRIPEAA